MSTKAGTDPISQNDLKDYHNTHVAPYLNQGGGSGGGTIGINDPDTDNVMLIDTEDL